MRDTSETGGVSRRRFLAGAGAAGAALLTGVGPNALADGSPFVRVSGTRLKLRGRTWYLNGGSIYGTSNPGGATSGAIKQIVDLGRAAGLNTLRIVNFFEEGSLASPQDPTIAPYRESDWQRVDAILARLHREGMKAILDLSAFRNCLGAWLHPTISPYHVDALGYWENFIAFVTSRVNTVNGRAYRSDPTIAIVSFAGEPEPPNSAEPLKAASTQELTDFYAAVFAMWRAGDPNHLLSSGGLLHIDWEEVYGNPNGSGIDVDAIVGLSDHDVPSIHTYWAFHPPTAANDFKSPKFSRACARARKPWITEEFGWKQVVVDGSTDPPTSSTDADRAAWFRLVYRIQRNPDPHPAPGQRRGIPSAGVAFWNLGLELHADSHDVNRQTAATWRAVKTGPHEGAGGRGGGR